MEISGRFLETTSEFYKILGIPRVFSWIWLPKKDTAPRS